MPHLVVSISGHGFGHVAQTAPILNLLPQHIEQLQITVRSAVPFSHLTSRIQVPFTHLPSEGDLGMVMSSALDVLVEESRATYHQFHLDWNKRIKEEAQFLLELEANFVLSNVGYLPLAGAKSAGIPHAALCSLNWADIYQHYCGGCQGEIIDQVIVEQIQNSYAQADAFFRLTPGMEMSTLPNLISVNPVAAWAVNRRDEINKRLKLSREEKLVLLSLGGISGRLPIESWPVIENVRYLVMQNWHVDHPQAVNLESLQMDFCDILASCDALIGKPGYGSFVEATTSEVPVMYVGRPDWPESIALNNWLHQHNICYEIDRTMLEQGNIEEALNHLWDSRRPARIIPNGADEVANWLSNKIQ